MITRPSAARVTLKSETPPKRSLMGSITTFLARRARSRESLSFAERRMEDISTVLLAGVAVDMTGFCATGAAVAAC